MIRRAGCSAEGLHFLDHEGDERVGVEQCFCLLIEIGLVGRAATFRHAKKTVFHALGRLDVDLGRQVALRVHLVVHREGRILRVAQIFFRIRFVDAFREGLLIAEAGPDLLALFSVDDGGPRVLAERQLAFGRHFGIAQEGERYVFVVVRSLGVGKDFGHLLVVRTAKEKRHVAESGVGHSGQSFGGHFQDGFALELADRHVVLGQQVILSLVLTQLEHGRVLKFRCLCHSYVIVQNCFVLFGGRPSPDTSSGVFLRPGGRLGAGGLPVLAKLRLFVRPAVCPPEKFIHRASAPRRTQERRPRRPATSSGVSASRPWRRSRRS